MNQSWSRVFVVSLNVKISSPDALSSCERSHKIAILTLLLKLKLEIFDYNSYVSIEEDANGDDGK
jgi:hypothetical protein